MKTLLQFLQEDTEEKGRKKTSKADEQKVIDFFLSLKKPPKDENEIHTFAEKEGINTHALEEIIYGLFYKYIRLGVSKPIADESEVDPDELKLGIEVEMEHTDYPDIAKLIALNHLEEIDDYYTRLKEMEK